MKIQTGCLVGVLLLCPFLAVSKPAQLKGTVYSPEPGDGQNFDTTTFVLTDAGGLFLEVSPAGSKRWFLKSKRVLAWPSVMRTMAGPTVLPKLRGAGPGTG